MTTLNQIQQAIQTLSPEALNKLEKFIQVLKKNEPTLPDAASSIIEKTDAAPDDWSDFIGCGSGPSDLSVNYKAYLAEGWAKKHGHR
ncbi:MAG: hypothetical protein AB8B99_05400 [Phormidesmis sp.]